MYVCVVFLQDVVYQKLLKSVDFHWVIQKITREAKEDVYWDTWYMNQLGASLVNKNAYHLRHQVARFHNT